MKRGDIWIVDLNPGFGREIHKKRPALILSSNKVNAGTINAIIVPSSTQLPATIGPDMVKIDNAEGVDRPSVLLPIFIRSIDQKRLIKKVGVLSKIKMREVEESIRLILNLEEEL